MSNENELVTVAEFSTEFDAEMAKECLEDNDIKAIVVGEELVSMVTSMVPVWIEVKVFEKDVERAKAVLEIHYAQCENSDDDDMDDDQDGCNCDCDCDSDCGSGCGSDSDSDCDCDCDCDCDSDCDCDCDAGEDA